MPKLVLKFRDNVLREIPVSENPITIGRTEENDIIINNLGVSRKHARISKQDMGYILEDLASRNGTLINNKEIQQSKLQDKDEITIGKHSLIFIEHENIDNVIHFEPTDTDTKDETSAEETIKFSDHKTRPLKKDDIRQGMNATKAGVIILDGGIEQENVIFQRLLVVAGKGPSVDIKIKGQYDKEVVFIISHRPNGYFISPPKGISLLVNGKNVNDYLRLNHNDIIEAAETKMQFFAE